MRICTRCGAKMIEDRFTVAINKKHSDVILIPKRGEISEGQRHIYGIGKPLNVAFCPECGEVSIYSQMKKHLNYDGDYSTIMALEINEAE